ncbi:hypothetical protein [Microcoleus sp. EPA2]
MIEAQITPSRSPTAVDRPQSIVSQQSIAHSRSCHSSRSRKAIP